MQDRWRRWAARIAGWVLVPALGLGLRLASTWTPPGNTWTLDAAGHHRWIAWLVEHGRLPSLDPLSDLPAGRDISRFLPVGLYHAAALWHRITSAIGGHDLDASLRLFTALAGALVAWPVWVMARTLGAGPWSAALAALVAVTLPAHLEHTTAFLLRYDAPGTLLVATHLALGVAGIVAATVRRTLILSVLSGFALLAALAVWRVPLVLPAFEAAAVAILAIRRAPSSALRLWFGTTAIALLAACASLEYLRAQHAILSIPVLGVLVLAGALQCLAFEPLAARALTRAALLIVPAAFAGVLGARIGSAGDYGAMGELLRMHALWWVGIEPGVEGMTGVLLTVRELQPMPVRGLFGSDGFSWLGAWLLAVPLLLWLRAWRSPRAAGDGAREALGLILGVTLALLVLTLLANRYRLLLAPPVAALVGVACAACLAELGRLGSEPVPSRRRIARLLIVLALVTLLPCLGLLFRDSWHCATRAKTRLEPGWAAALAHVRDHAGGRPVLSLWERGYEIQRYGGAATLTDGMLESPVNQSHIVEVARALLAPTSDSLAALGERFDVGLVVLPPSWALFGVAMAAGDPMAMRIASHEPLTPAESDRVGVRMIVLGSVEPPFEPVFEQDGYRVYRRTTRVARHSGGDP
jgi:hypothetical protein